jgi:hypothetical protein
MGGAHVVYRKAMAMAQFYFQDTIVVSTRYYGVGSEAVGRVDKIHIDKNCQQGHPIQANFDSAHMADNAKVIMVDAAIGESCSVVAAVFADKDGRIFSCSAERCDATCSEIAELWAIYEGLKLAFQLDVWEVVIKSDAINQVRQNLALQQPYRETRFLYKNVQVY